MRSGKPISLPKALSVQINSHHDFSHFPSDGGLARFLEETKTLRTLKRCLFEFNSFPPTSSVAYDAEGKLGIMCPHLTHLVCIIGVLKELLLHTLLLQDLYSLN